MAPDEIKDRLKLLEENLLEEELQGIEQKGTTQKAYDAVKTLRKRKPKKKLKVFDTEGNLTNTEKEQVKIVTDIFKETFEIPDMEEPKQYPPCPNPHKFTKEEVQKLSQRLKNGSPGIDNVKAEEIKYAPEEVHESIAEMLKNRKLPQSPEKRSPHTAAKTTKERFRAKDQCTTNYPAIHGP